MGKVMRLEKACLKTRKKYGNKRNVYIKFHLKDYLEIEFTAC